MSFIIIKRCFLQTKQKWETWHTHKEALKRKAEVENQQNNGTFLPPNNQKVSAFLYDFVSTYGEKKWGVSMYDSQTALIANYINPIIGDMEVQDITTRVVDKYIQTLQKTPSVSRKNRKARTEFVTNSTIEKIIKLLRCAFKQAVRWELIEKNPFDNVVLPKTEYKKRDIWDAETIRLALDQCTDSKLYIAMNLAFACSLRMGEILGLTWKNVHIEDENIATDNAYIYIEAELARASKQAIETLGEKDIYHIFTPLMPNTSTRIILKKPKTDSSIRKVWLPKTVAYILREWKTSQEELKSFLGDEYQDFDLVVALPNGRPCENRIIEKEFSLLKQKAGLPNVVFHSLRHSSTTYKLKLNHGDLKVTQGDTGHAEIDMITKVYAHILDEDRKINAQKFESAFYANPDLRKVTPPQEQPQAQTIDLAALIEQLQKSPELTNTLAALIAGQKAV
ncbi:site-specific integrase [[Ruminococcus] torques]